MDPFTVSHFSDRALLHDLKALVAQDRKTTAVLLTRIAEVEERKLYRQAGYDSMFACCLHELHFSEDAAYRHITAARVARRFPGVLVALAEGRLHMRAVLMLARHLTSGNADELVAAATHKTRAEIELLLAQRFPRPDLPQRLQAVPSPAVLALVATPPAPEPAGELAPERVEAEAPRPRVTPLAPERFGLQVTLDQETYDLLQQARALMSHQNPAGDIASVLKRALELLVGRLEKRKVRRDHAPRQSAAHSLRPAYPGGGEARGAGARRRPLHVRERERPALPGTRADRIRTRKPGGARGRCDGGKRAPPVPGAQSARRRVRLRGRVHGAQARGRAAVSNCRKPVPSMLMTNKRRAPEACFENTTARPPGCQAGCASASTSRCGPMPLVSASHTSGRFAPSEVCAQWDQTIMPPTGDHRGY